MGDEEGEKRDGEHWEMENLREMERERNWKGEKTRILELLSLQYFTEQVN